MASAINDHTHHGMCTPVTRLSGAAANAPTTAISPMAMVEYESIASIAAPPPASLPKA